MSEQPDKPRPQSETHQGDAMTETNQSEWPTTTLDVAPTTQGIAVFDGTEFPVFLSDNTAPLDALEYLTDVLVRQVTVRRLRYWADVLSAETDTEDPS